MKARTLEKRALQEVGGFEATSAEKPFDATYCHRRATAVSEIIDYDPAPAAGPVVSRTSALRLSICPASTSSWPQTHPPYCGPVLWWAGARSRRRAHRSWWGLRAKWPHAKCGAAALFCGVPPRLTPWAVRHSLGLPTGVFWLPTWPKMSFNRISRVSAVFEVAP